MDGKKQKTLTRKNNKSMAKWCRKTNIMNKKSMMSQKIVGEESTQKCLKMREEGEEDGNENDGERKL